MTKAGIGKRLVKRLGIEVSELGFGAWGIGGSLVGVKTPIDGPGALLAYLEAGGNFIDTAETYGESETVVGKTLKEFGGRDSVYVATKTKCGETADTVSQIRAHAEESLRKIGRERLDVLYLHLPPEDDETIDAALGECEKLRKEGKIRGIGASIKGPSVTADTIALCKKYVDSGRVDMLQVIYSILRQKNLESIAYAASRDVAIVCRTVMESGFLTGKYPPGTRFPADDHRARWNSRIDPVLEAVQTVRDEFLPAGYALPGHLSVQFALTEPDVTSVIVGAKNVPQEQENLTAYRLPPLDNTLRQKVIDRFGGFTEYVNPEE